MPILRRLGAIALPLSVAILLGPLPHALAAERGVIKGRVINAGTGDPQAGVRVILTGALDDGSDPITRRVLTDASGSYRFTGLDTSEERSYAIDGRYQGGFFTGRPLRFPEGTVGRAVIDSTLRVWETTTDPASVLISRDDMFAVLGERGLAIIESVTVVNQTDMAYIGRGTGTAKDPAPSIGFSLPVECSRSQVTIVDSDVDIPQIVCTDFGFGITAAIPPGETRTTFSYRIPGTGSDFDLSRTALYDIATMTVFAADPLAIESNKLVQKGEVTLAGESYDRYELTDPARPGDSIQILAIARAGLNAGLVAGIVAALMFLGLLAFLSFRRARRPAPVEAIEVDPEDEESVTAGAIARLDVDYRNGELTRKEWSAMRKELKQRLAGEHES